MARTRLNPDRYAVHGEFRSRIQRSIPMDDNKVARIEVLSADLLEKGSGYIWTSGAFKVTLQNVPGMRSKTFYGETAWSDAARYASDAATAAGDWRWYPDL
jgi:hypothetical protein